MSERKARSFSFNQEQLKIGNRTYYLSLTMLDKMHLEKQLNIQASSLIGLAFENLQAVSSYNLAVLFQHLITTKNFKPSIEHTAKILDQAFKQLGFQKVIEAISVAILKSFYTDVEAEQERKNFHIRMKTIADANEEAQRIHERAQLNLNKKKEHRKKCGQKQF
ncbi:MAG: hypothetical protein ACRC17_02035 [Culicoidibacterales bacterium]